MMEEKLPSIKEIREELEQITATEKERAFSNYQVEQFLIKYHKDSRSGIQQLCKKAEKYIKSILTERERIKEMSALEKEYASLCVAGMDEVGRGPLAGPVVAGIVVLNPEKEILYLNDSKKLSDEKRRELVEEIKEKALAYSVGMVDHERIDQINILNATYEAMAIAWNGLKFQPQILLNDAVKVPQIPIRQVPITKGDSKSISIAAASILAKVTRDDLMLAYDSIYPEYQFAKNKGYGTAEHIKAIREVGLCEIHRRTFVKSLLQ